jgi:hypothetical protein
MAEELKALGERGDVRLFGGERQLHLLSQKDGKFFLFGTGLFLGPVNEHHKVSSAGEFHPRALAETDVRLSPHPAPIVRPRPCRRRQ